MLKYYFTNPSDLQKHDEKSISLIVKTYESAESINSICSKYSDLNLSISKLTKSIPYEITEEKCCYCNNPVYTRPRRDNKLRYKEKLCIKCLHDYTNNCKCNSCLEAKQKQLEFEQQRFEKFWTTHLNETYKHKWKTNDLSIYDEIYLSLFCNYYSDPTASYLNFKNYEAYLGTEFETKIEYFIKKQILIPSKHCHKDIVYFYENKGKLKELHFCDYYWELNLKNNENHLTIENYSSYFKDINYTCEEKEALWEIVYKEEIIQYIEKQCENIIHIPFNDFTKEYICELLIEKFSLAKAFSLIYSALKSCLWYKEKHKPKSNQISSFFNNKIATFCNDQDIFSKKTAQEFNRPIYLDTSTLSQYIIKNIFQNEANYFYLNKEQITGVRPDSL